MVKESTAQSPKRDNSNKSDTSEGKPKDAKDEAAVKKIAKKDSDDVSNDVSKPELVLTSPTTRGNQRQVNVVEEVIAHVQGLYNDEKDGLLLIAQTLDIEIEAPRQKVSVMIVGNHSAGKSSFINWYIGDHVQDESVAMETSSFTFISSGKKRETFKGRATVRHKPYLTEIEQFPGAIENLATRISPSRQKLFPLCDFIDTPGLTDGSLKYPYPVNEIITWLGSKADLIFVCFDPHGQALCERTMNVVHSLSTSEKSKMHYFLTMADRIPTEKERSKVILQMAQSLSHLHSQNSIENEKWLGEHALRVRPIFLPDKVEASSSKNLDFNRIDEVIELIGDTVNQHVQNHIERIESDAQTLLYRTESAIRRFESRTRVNRCISFFRVVLLLVAWAIPTVLCCYLAHFIEAVLVPKEMLDNPYLKPLLDGVHIVSSLAGLFDETEERYRILAILCGIFVLFILLTKILTKCKLEVQTDQEAKQLVSWDGILRNLIHVEIPSLWKRYFSDSTFEE